MGTRPFLVAVATALSAALILIPDAGAVRIGEVPLEPGSGPNDVVTGSDGNLFVTEETAGRVDRVRPDGGIIGQFTLGGVTPVAITAGPDGNLWVAEFTARKIAKVTTIGGIAHFPSPGTTIGNPRGIAAGPDGNSVVPIRRVVTP